MKNKLQLFLILALISTLIISAPLSVSAKTNKIGKPLFGKLGTFIETKSDGIYSAKTLLPPYCKGAKKCEFYRSKTEKGKYKKVATVKNEHDKKIKALTGLSFYKARGVNGSRKGKFSSPQAAYGAGLTITECKVNTANKSIDVKMFVDNSKSSRDMLFVRDTEIDGMYVYHSLTKNELKEIYENLKYDEDGDAYIEEGDEVQYIGDTDAFVEFTGKMLDENGNEVKNDTIEKNTTGYIRMSYSLKHDEDSGFDKEAEMKIAKLIIDKFLSGNTKKYSMDMNFIFKVNSGVKNYRFIGTPGTNDTYIGKY